MNLSEAILTIEGDKCWSIYAEEIASDADARIGKSQFKDGGIIDEKKLIMNGSQANDARLGYCDGDANFLSEITANELFFWMLDNNYFENLGHVI